MNSAVIRTPARWLAVVVVACTVLAACGLGGDSAEEGPISLRAIGFESCIVDGLRLQAEAYNALHPDVEIEIDAMSFTTLHERQLLELKGATGAYDIYSILIDWMPVYLEGDYLLDLTSRVEDKPPEGGLDAWHPTLLRFQSGEDGRLYGLPHHSGPQLLYYRTDLFEDPTNKADFEAEFGYPLKPPETWTQFIDISTFFTDPEADQWGTVLAAKFGDQQLANDFWFLLPTFGGGTGFDSDGNPTFGGAEGAETVRFYSDLVNEYQVAPAASTTFGIPEAGTFYLDGKAAMHWNWSHIGAQAEDPEMSAIVGNNGYTTLPSAPNGEPATYVSYWTLGIAKASRHHDAAYDFLRFATDAEHDKLLADAGCIPSRLSSWNDPELLERYPFYRAFEPTYSGFATSSPRVATSQRIDDLIQRRMSDVLSGKSDAATAMATAAVEIVPFLDEE